MLVTLDFRLSTTCLYSATLCCQPPLGMRKTTSTPRDMHPFHSSLVGTAVDPAWQWRVATGKFTKASPRNFQRSVTVGHLGVEREMVLLVPIDARFTR
jgi:nitrate reductase alpha subunit